MRQDGKKTLKLMGARMRKREKLCRLREKKRKRERNEGGGRLWSEGKENISLKLVVTGKNENEKSRKDMVQMRHEKKNSLERKKYELMGKRKKNRIKKSKVRKMK